MEEGERMEEGEGMEEEEKLRQRNKKTIDNRCGKSEHTCNLHTLPGPSNVTFPHTLQTSQWG